MLPMKTCRACCVIGLALAGLQLMAAPLPPLLGHWPLNEGEGTHARDRSGNGWDGVIQDGQWTPAAPGVPASLTLRAGRVTIPERAMPGAYERGALLFWFKPDTAALPKKGGSLAAVRDRLTVSLNGPALLWVEWMTQDDCFVLYGKLPEPDAWYHAAVLWSGHTYELWLNGVLVSERLASPNYAVQRGGLILGSRGRYEKYSGALADVRLYADALPEADVAAVFAEGRAGRGAPVLDGRRARTLALDAVPTNLPAPAVRGPFYEQALAESLQPVRPGGAAGAPFWNFNVRRFIYAPAFGPSPQYGSVQAVSNAAAYRFTAVAAKTGARVEFEAPSPHAALTPIWADLPVDTIFLTVTALGTDGAVLGPAGERRFYRAAAFNGPYGGTNDAFRAGGVKALEYLYGLPYVQAWRTRTQPDYDGYIRYCYPSKMIGAMMCGVKALHDLSADQPGRQAELVAMGRNMADFMISASLQAGPLAGMPPTYYGDKAAAALNAGKLFIAEPVGVANGYLAIHALTGDARYLEAAVRIAEVYREQQLPSGTWHARYLFSEEGGPMPGTAPFFVPLGILQFLKRMIGQHGQAQFAGTVERGASYLETHVLEPFHFAGQFDDSGDGGRNSRVYVNMAANAAASCARWLLEDPTPRNLARAEEIMRFCEDQFVVWERRTPEVERPFEGWLTPCVTEQSASCFSPVAASAGGVARAFMAMHRATGKPIYREKALSIARSFLRAQAPSGLPPTFWIEGQIESARNQPQLGSFWFNCGLADALFMLEADAWVHTAPGAAPAPE